MRFLLLFPLILVFGCSTSNEESDNTPNKKESKKLKEKEISPFAPLCNEVEGFMISWRKDSLLPAYSPMFELIPEDYTGIVKACRDDRAVWFAEYENGKANGIMVRYNNPDREISSLDHFKNGKEYGISYRYHSAGIVSEKCRYVNGLKHGVQESYDSDGALKGTVQYNDGQIDFRSQKGDYFGIN